MSSRLPWVRTVALMMGCGAATESVREDNVGSSEAAITGYERKRGDGAGILDG